MPEMQQMQPCARCEQEFPESFFTSPNAPFCKRCEQEVSRILRKKYNIIQAAHFRAQLRRSSKLLQQKMHAQAASGAGD